MDDLNLAAQVPKLNLLFIYGDENEHRIAKHEDRRS